jgi:hypothetical protein
MDALAASVWFLRSGQHFRPSPPETLVLVDPTETRKPLGSSYQTTYLVNCCTRGDAIHFHYRPRSRRGRSEPSVGRRPPVSLLMSYLPIHPPDGGIPLGDDLRNAAKAN